MKDKCPLFSLRETFLRLTASLAGSRMRQGIWRANWEVAKGQRGTDKLREPRPIDQGKETESFQA
jgi:hypothetical protein